MDSKPDIYDKSLPILVTGATGYIGSRLIKVLGNDGYWIRCFSRKPEPEVCGLFPNAEAFQGDLFKPETIIPALKGVHTAYYLVHSMGGSGDFEEADRIAALNFGGAARAAGIRKIIYLGGLGEPGQLSSHLRSRQEVGHILRGFGLPVTEFRASIIIGAGSISFEIMRTITERFPVLLDTRWSETECQPIYVGDVISYLTAELEKPVRGNRIYEIGASDASCYLCLMKEYARLRRLKRYKIYMPLLDPDLASYPLAILSPEHYRVGKWLIRSLKTPTIVKDDKARREFDVKPMGTVKAIRRAMTDEDREFEELSWSDKLSGIKKKPYGGIKVGSRYVDTYIARVNCPPEFAFAPVKRLGGETGWYCANTLWRIRGAIDQALGGPGMRHCRPDDENCMCRGDILDCWKVDFFKLNSRLKLKADMKVPGRAWLDFEVQSEIYGSNMRVTAVFDPKGLFGLIYWYCAYPFHSYIFRGMLQEMARIAGVESGGGCEIIGRTLAED